MSKKKTEGFSAPSIRKLEEFCDRVLPVLFQLKTATEQFVLTGREGNMFKSIKEYRELSGMIRHTSPQLLTVFIALLFDMLTDNIEELFRLSGLKQWDIELPVNNVLTIEAFDETKGIQTESVLM